MRKIILLVVVLAVLGGGGAGAYFYFFNNTAEAAIGEDGKPIEAGEGEKADEHAKEAEGGDHGGGHGEGGTQFVELDPLILPIVDKDGVNQITGMGLNVLA